MNKFLKKIKFFNWIYKIQKIYKNSFPNKHFAQFGEDILVSTIFRNIKKGFYVDIGAYHPFKGSLTYNLYKKGWQGVNIDLSKASIELFQIARPSDTNINCAISSENKETFYYENSPINQQNSLEENPNAQKIEINCYKLNTILDKYEVKKVDYMNIDAEGNDFKVISTFNFKKFNPTLVSIEFNDYNLSNLINSEINILMEKNNYQLISKFGVTCFYVQKENIEKIKNIMSIQ